MRKSITNQMSKDSNKRVKKYKCAKENMCRSFSEENINKHVVIRQTRAPGANWKQRIQRASLGGYQQLHRAPGRWPAYFKTFNRNGEFDFVWT